MRLNAAKWFLSKFNQRIRKITNYMENFKLRDATVELVFNMMSDIAHLEKRLGREEADKVVRLILDDWITMLSPMIPHIAEEIWSIIGNSGFVSLAEWPKLKEEMIDPTAELKEQAIIDLEKDIVEIINLLKKQPSKIKLIAAADWKRKLFKRLASEFKDRGINMGTAMKVAMSDPEIRKYGKQVQQIVQKIVKNRKLIPQKVISREDEVAILEEARDYLEKELGCEIEITNEEDVKEPSEKNKAKQALPLKPGIIIY